ncbi:hypothetical protein GCM10009616_34620 [Microlunatus lacustris]
MNTLFGLPVHPLIVHATAVIVPAAALAVLLVTFWPRFRRWAGWGPAAAAATALVLVPLTTTSGESLQARLPQSDLIQRHAQLGDTLLPWTIGLLVGAAGLYWTHRTTGRSYPRRLTVAIAVVSVAAAVGTLVEVVIIGHSGATAAWSDV